jgi:glutamate 5-kinase
MRIVVKLGTSTITHSTGRLNIRQVEDLCKVMSDLKNSGHELIIVSSGAIGMGVGKLSLGCRPKDTPTKQAAAAVGQCELMYTYDRLFSLYSHTVAQILLVAADLNDKERHNNFQNTVKRLLELGAIPIINENDTVATEELGIGDNDTLAAVVAVSLKADLLILMSDIDGLYSDDPHINGDARLIPVVTDITPDILALAGAKGSELATGGMATKLHAAQITTDSGVDMIITNGASPQSLYSIVDGQDIGTRFIGKGKKK